MKVEEEQLMIPRISYKLLDYRSRRNGLVWFYGISTIVDHLMPNPFHTYTLNI